MKNIIIFLSLFYLCACSNDDNTELVDGGSAFLHTVSDVGLIYLDGEERPYGTVEYGGVSSLISLEEGEWDLSVEAWNDGNPAANDVLLKTDFTVIEEVPSLYALLGQHDSLELLRLSYAYDEVLDIEDPSSSEEDHIYINVSHIHPDLGEIDIYLLDTGEDISTASAITSLNFKETSSSIIFDDLVKTLVVTLAGDKDQLLFNSGEKDIYDQAYQTLIIADNADPQEDITAYYHIAGFEAPFVWRSNDGVSRVRILNAIYSDDMQGHAISTFTTDSSIGDCVSPCNLIQSTYSSQGQLTETVEALQLGFRSSYIQVPSGFYDFDAGLTQGSAYLSSGLNETFIVVGRLTEGQGLDKLSTIKVSDTQYSIFNEARFSLTHLAYYSDTEDLLSYNVHLTKDNIVEDLATRMPEISSLSLKDTGLFTKAINVTETETYTLRVMKEDNSTLIASLSLLLSPGDNCQLALIQSDSGSGFTLYNITEPVGDDAPDGMCSIQ